MSERMVKLEPTGVYYRFTPNGTLENAIMAEISNLTGKTPKQLGVVSTSIYEEYGSKQRHIITTFEVEKVRQITTIGVNKIASYPDLDKLKNHFFAGKIDGYVFEERKGKISFDWHKRLLLAHICDISVMDPVFSVAMMRVTKDKPKRNTEMMIEVKGSMNHAPYDPSEAEAYLVRLNERLNGK